MKPGCASASRAALSAPACAGLSACGHAQAGTADRGPLPTTRQAGLPVPARQTGAPAGLPVQRACDLSAQSDRSAWLIEGLWAEQAVGILGGEPKCCKSFLALDLAVGVASGAPCLRRFAVRRTGPVLLFPAEDALPVVRQRLEGICAAAGTCLQELPLYVITAPRLLLDLPQDRERLRETVAAIQPALLVLDPFIRLHRADENASKEIAPLLGYLRELQREFQLAVLLVHHVRKRSAKDRPGQALRGSSDLHGWGDSNLYLRRHGEHLVLSVEHRAAASVDDVTLELIKEGPALALGTREASPPADPQPVSPAERVLQVLQATPLPLSAQELRKLCGIRTATFCETLAALRREGRVTHNPDGYRLAQTQNIGIVGAPLPAVSVPVTPLGNAGNGNGKRRPASPTPSPQLSLFSGETQAGSAGTQPAQG